METGKYILIKEVDFDMICKSINVIKDKIISIEQKTNNTDIKYIDNNEAKSLLKVSTSTLQKLRDRGELEYYKKGNKIYYSPESINNYIKNGRT